MDGVFGALPMLCDLPEEEIAQRIAAGRGRKLVRPDRPGLRDLVRRPIQVVAAHRQLMRSLHQGEVIAGAVALDLGVRIRGERSTAHVEAVVDDDAR